MDGEPFPDDCAKQWEILLLLLATEEKKLGITADSEVKTMDYFLKREGVSTLFKHWLEQMQSSYADKVTDTDTARKSEAISLYWRQQGNECFKKSLVKESYRCYTKSVLYAEPKGRMYPLALANRSAALLHMKKFKECLEDIELALNNGYPKAQQHKLFLRQTDCFIKLNQPDKAREALELATEYLKSVNAQSNQNAEFQRHVKTLEAKLKTYKDSVDLVEQHKVLPTYLESENIDFVCASNSVAVRNSAQCGRHVVAETGAQRGDCLFDEKAYAIVALPIEDNLAIVCETCFHEDVNAVPCKVCSRSVYCSEACRDEGWNVFHQWECVGAQAVLFPTVGIAHLALRVLLVSTNKGFPPIEKGETTALSVADVFKAYTSMDKTQIYKRGVPEFYRMFNLVTNLDKMRSMDFLQYALTATMLTLYLEHHTTFFEHLRSRLPYTLCHDDVKWFCAAMILRHLGQLVCNGHSAQTLITYLPEEESFAGKTVCERELRYSTAIYPSAAMMNHACDPNIINTFYRDRLIIRCGREIPAGGEVLNCYGPHKSRETYAQRRAQLYQQYCFSCKCATCSDSGRRDFSLLFSAFACQLCKGPVIRGDTSGTLKCQKCKTTRFDLVKAAQLMGRADEIIEQIQNGHPQQVCEKLVSVLRLKQQVLHQHNYELRQTVDDLARFYTERGDHQKSIELLKMNIQSVEFQYGSFSVEVAHDLRKLGDVMLERIIRFPNQSMYREWCMETNKVFKKTVQLMELNYGGWERMVRELRDQEARVAALIRENWPNAADSIHHNLHYNLKI